MIKTEPLEWDSRFFGVDIARVWEVSREEQLDETLASLRDGGTQLVYCSVPPPLVLTPPFLARWGGELVDRRVMFRRDLTGQPRLSRWEDRVSLYTGREPSDGLLQRAVDSGRYSRFRADRRLRPRYRDLFRLWMANSVNGPLADAVIVCGGDDGPQGMVTVAAKDSRGQIGLIAVARDSRRAGVGKLLMTHASDWFITSGNTHAVVVTQAENREACSLYERCGYRAWRQEHTYHFWIADVDRA